MSQNEFMPFTVLAAVAFGSALVWVLIQWLRADEVTEAVEQEVQRHLAAFGKTPPVKTSPEEARQAQEKAYELEERVLGKLLWIWGVLGTLFGMFVGSIAYGFLGALLGAVAGSVLGIVGAVVRYSMMQAKVEAAEKKPDLAAKPAGTVELPSDAHSKAA